jgi:hypothetical protein
LQYYNPFETPVEDEVMTDLCGRLRLVNTGQKSVMVVSEDKKFITKLNDLLCKASLPFFSIVNEVCLFFEASNEAVKKAGSLQKLIFGNIRKSSVLKNFLVNVISDMKVVISIYDADASETMEWKEMIAYLAGFRNPFVTVQLLPEYVEPEQGMISHVPDDLIPRYASVLKQEQIQLPGEVNELLDPEDTKGDGATKNSQKGKPDIDGGLHPTWNEVFKINFKPPKLTSCPVMFTDIMQMEIENARKYIVVMVREASDKSLFMTAYDPRTATEYMLFGGPPDWIKKGKSIEEEKEENDNKSSLSRLDRLQRQLEDAIEKHMNPASTPEERFRLGFAITPRLIISVFNQTEKSDAELLGFCQVSISSVLSGSGNKSFILPRLMHMETKAGRQVPISVGVLQLELEYTKQSDLDAIEESKIRAKQRKKGNNEGTSQAPQAAQGEATNRADISVAASESPSSALKELEELRLKHTTLLKEAEELRKKSSAVPALESLTPNTPGLKVMGEVTPLAIERADGSLDSIVSGILDVFVARHRLQHCSQNGESKSSDDVSAKVNSILRPLIKSIGGYVDRGADRITPYGVEQLFTDLLITFTSRDSEVWNFYKFVLIRFWL